MKLNIDVNPNYKNISIEIKAPKMDDELTEIIKQLEQVQSSKHTIAGKDGDKIYLLKPAEVYMFYSMNGKVYAQTENSLVEVKRTIYSLEEVLDTNTFLRISKSAIVNVSQIENIEVSFNGSLIVKFDNGCQEMISRRYLAKVKEFIGLGGRQ